MKRVRRLMGQVVCIDLKDGYCSYARILEEPLFAFYDNRFQCEAQPTLEDICVLPITFKIDVMNYAVIRRHWEVVGACL